jgi:hypothetical protein
VTFGICPSGRHLSQIQKVLKHRVVDDNKRSNTLVAFNGDVETVNTFEGPRWYATGRMTFEYFGTRVLAVDFDRDMFTDFGYVGYRMTTTQNISGWCHALRQMFFIGVRCLAPGMGALNWTISRRRNDKSPVHPAQQKTHEDKLLVKFRTGAPWVRDIDGDPWFDGRAYDIAAVENAERINREICDGFNWRWFTADWVNGLWTKRFIDEAAEKRWLAWRKRREVR